jgi:hypothetical protein
LLPSLGVVRCAQVPGPTVLGDTHQPICFRSVAVLLPQPCARASAAARRVHAREHSRLAQAPELLAVGLVLRLRRTAHAPAWYASACSARAAPLTACSPRIAQQCRQSLSDARTPVRNSLGLGWLFTECAHPPENALKYTLRRPISYQWMTGRCRTTIYSSR